MDDISETVERRVAGKTYVLPADYKQQFDEAFNEDDDEAREFSKFFDEMAESNDYAKITVYRVPVNDKGALTSRKLAYLFDFALGEMTYSQMSSKIRDDYGSGVYRVQIRDQGGQLMKQRTVNVEAPKNAETKPVGDNLVNQIAYLLNQQSERTDSMLERMRPAQSEISIDKILAWGTAAATILSTLGFTFKAKPEKTIIETAQELATLKGLFSGDEGGESNFFSLMEKTVTSFGPAFAQAIALGQDRGQVSADGTIRRRLSAPENLQGAKMDSNVLQMKPQLEFILTQAQMNNSPPTVADFMIDNISESDKITDEQIEAIIVALQDKNCYGQCVAVVPGFREFPEWFDAWRMAMITGLEGIFDSDGNETLTGVESSVQDSAESLTETNSATDAGHAHGNSGGSGRDKNDADDHAANRPAMEKESVTPAVDS